MSILKSRTFWGSIALAASKLLVAPAITAVEVLEAAGIILTAIGLRGAILKSS